MKSIKLFFFALIFAGLFSGINAQDKKNELIIPSVWTNEDGSVLYIWKMDPNGMIYGNYINHAKDCGCKNISYQLTGWVIGTAISFSVKWDNAIESCNSLTSWTGFLNDDGINTVTQTIVNGTTYESQIIKGKELFKLTPQKKRNSLLINKN